MIDSIFEMKINSLKTRNRVCRLHEQVLTKIKDSLIDASLSGAIPQQVTTYLLKKNNLEGG